tara:strand:- start:40 stop:708 length:669 start_codon:yes stop_codon:yes gene_type:complete
VQQNQDIKGFTILELLAVLVIVVAVSAMGFPNFISWKTEREIRLATEKVSSMITNINTQVKRGNFLYVQLQISPNGVKETNFTTKGIYQDTYSNILNDSNIKIECKIQNSKYWDEHKVETTSKSVAVHFDVDSSVCFSKDGSKFLKEGKLKSNINLKIAGEEKADYLILCAPRNAEKTGNKCALDPRKVGKPSYGKPSYLVLWTRFGTVKKYKWSGSDWNLQ